MRSSQPGWQLHGDNQDHRRYPPGRKMEELTGKVMHPPIMQLDSVDDHSVHFVGLNPGLIDGLLFGGGGRGGGNQQVIPVNGSLFAHAFHEHRMEGFRMLGGGDGQDVADGVCFLPAQLPGSTIGNIAHFQGSLPDFFPGGRGNIRIAIKSAGDCGDGQV